MSDRLLDLCLDYGFTARVLTRRESGIASLSLRHASGMTLDVTAGSLNEAIELATEQLEARTDELPSYVPVAPTFTAKMRQLAVMGARVSRPA